MFGHPTLIKKSAVQSTASVLTTVGHSSHAEYNMDQLILTWDYRFKMVGDLTKL